jgi:glycosyltransferase involved in cell wall biosynthesis
MAAYNGARYIREQIASILPQLSGNDKITIVDDASSDETVAVVESFGDARIRILRQASNCGVVKSFERAIREATGEIVFLADQDDVWHPDKIARMMKAFAADREATLILSNGEMIDADGRSLSQRLNVDERFSAGILSNLLKNRYQGSTMAFRREILPAVLPFPRDIPMHDSWIGLVNAIIGRTVYLHDSLLLYRRHESNVTEGRHGTVGRMFAQRWALVKNLICRMKTLARVRKNLRLRTESVDDASSRTKNQVNGEGVRSLRRAIVFAPFFSVDAPTNRPRFVGAVLAEKMPTDVVTSDFDHSAKSKSEARQCAPFAKIVYLRTRPYRSNVGIARLLSHLSFSLEGARYFRKNRDKYDVVYATVPLNVLTWLVFILAGAKTKIVDVVDIWPDALPFPRNARAVLSPIFAVWKWFFKSAVAKADIVMAVSDAFIGEAEKCANRTAMAKRFYIGHDRLASSTEKQSVFTIAYVGNLGRLYDFETLLDVLTEDELRVRAQLFVIGRGDRRDWLLGEMAKRKLHHRFFGDVYDQRRLAEILRSCHVGFNGYINTSAAFSYKASTYFAAGLPILNSMTGDLKRLVAERGLGENYEGGNRVQLRESILRLIHNGTAEMAASSESFFSSQLETSRIYAEIQEYLCRV